MQQTAIITFIWSHVCGDLMNESPTSVCFVALFSTGKIWQFSLLKCFTISKSLQLCLSLQATKPNEWHKKQTKGSTEELSSKSLFCYWKQPLSHDTQSFDAFLFLKISISAGLKFQTDWKEWGACFSSFYWTTMAHGGTKLFWLILRMVRIVLGPVQGQTGEIRFHVFNVSKARIRPSGLYRSWGRSPFFKGQFHCRQLMLPKVVVVLRATRW